MSAPQPRNPRQIFLSHASRDQPFARRLAHDLRRHGWQIWLAPDSIQPGEGWVQAINRGLQESGVFLLVLTEHALNSRWVRSETDAAIEMEHQGQLRFLPLAMEAVAAPPLWRVYQWISSRSGYEPGWQQLLAQLGLDRQAAAPQQPAPPAAPEKRVEMSASSDKASARSKREKPQDKSPADNQPDSFMHPITGKEMVRVPAGEFLYGEDKQTVHLDEFWIDKTPVTNAEYKRFLDANPGHDVPRAFWGMIGRAIGHGKYEWDKRTRMYPQGKANHPVVLVSWHDAQAYAAWANAELPTEQQWEKAARGTDGRVYPWGDDWRENHANTKETGIGGTTPVAQFSPQGDSSYGCVDMVGNVWEWTSSRWEAGSYRRVLRGGSWFPDQNFARAAARDYGIPDVRYDYGGFRVVVVRRPPSQDR